MQTSKIHYPQEWIETKNINGIEVNFKFMSNLLSSSDGYLGEKNLYFFQKKKKLRRKKKSTTMSFCPPLGVGL